jgi:protein O-GlcNAc transferase
MKPSSFQIEGMLARAFAAHQAGNLAAAESLYRQVLQADKKQFDALHMLGVLKGQRGNFTAGLRRLNEALRVRPNSIDALINRGRMQSELGDDAGAVATYKEVLALNPRSALAHINFGVVLSRQRRSEDALIHCNAAIEIGPDYAEAWTCRANVLAELGRLIEALESYDRALFLQPKLAESHLGRGSVLHQLNRYDEALAAYDRALAVNPELGEAWYGRGRVFFALKRYDEAIAAYGKAMTLKPDYAEGARLTAKMQICDWDNLETECAHLVAAVTRQGVRSDPFRMLTVSASLADQKRCAEIFVADHCPAAERPLWRGERYRHDRIRIAYVSADFHNHPTAYLAAGLFEAQDRSRFETTAMSLGSDVDDEMRRRLRGAFERFLDVQPQGNRDIAETLRALEIDIAVDLKGYTTQSRPAVFALRPAPIQVNYLGYPGTMAASYIDYIIADRTVIPDDHASFYTEKIALLPDTYQVNDGTRGIAERTPTRAELGLPDEGFVYCCFNNSYKIRPAVFDVWMRLLQHDAGSVLWLLEDNSAVAGNLRREAERRGVAPDRLVFASRRPLADHMARHRQADLFLDTLPYNAHTTASDALWAGVPVLTCLGSTFAGRVAASLLNAVGLPELVTTSLADYEALALQIASDPALCGALKQKLGRNRQVFPLFDTARFTRHIEAAYTTMWQRYQAGEPPQSFAVEPS